MKNHFPALELIGGIFGIIATLAFVWIPVFTNDRPVTLFWDQLAGNIIFTVLLLVPFVMTIQAAFMLPAKSRWPILVSSSVLSLVWMLAATSLSQNFPDFPHPHPSTPFLFTPSIMFFFPATTALIIATFLSLRRGVVRTSRPKESIHMAALSFGAVLLLGLSLYVLFFNQGSEVWVRGTRVFPHGYWVRATDISHIPQLVGDQAEEFVSAGIVQPMMAWASAGLLALGTLCYVFLLQKGREPLSEIIEGNP